MRLPPPLRRYSAISVMVLTPEAASRPSSCSMATRSSRSSSKTSFAVAIASVLKALRSLCLILPCGCRSLLVEPLERLPTAGAFRGPHRKWSIRAVVGELQFQPHLPAAQQRDDGLQLVPVLAGYSDCIALDADLRLLFCFLDQADNFFGLFDGNALLKADLLADALAQGGLQLAVGQVLERDAPLDQLLAEDILDRFQMILAVGCQLDGVVAFQRDLRVGVLQVEALANLLQRLVNGVADLLNVHLADDVERILLGHGSIPSCVPARLRPHQPRTAPSPHIYQFPMSGLRSNSRLKFFVVAEAISSSGMPCRLANVCAVRLTQAGSFRLPRWGAGASQGASVS